MPTPRQDVATDLAPRGVLRASINLGNPVLASGTPEAPGGISVDLAREVARRLGVEVELVCFTAARDSFAALRDGDAELGFLAVEPAREAEVAFTAPYAVIEAVYAVPAGSSLTRSDDVDTAGVRIGVKRGSAYDLYLTRTLEHAELVRGVEGVTVYDEQALEAGAGIRQPVTAWVADHSGHRVLEPAFMEIRQAVAVRRDREPGTVDFLRNLVEELKADGFVADALAGSGQAEAARVAPPVSG